VQSCPELKEPQVAIGLLALEEDPMEGLNKMIIQVLWVALFFVFASGTSAQQCVQPPSGLVSWWPGDGDTNDIQNGNDGSFQGGTVFSPGLVAGAFSFDGQRYVSVDDDSSLQLTTAITLDAWINPITPTKGTMAIVKKAGLTAPDVTGYGLEVTGSQVSFLVFLNGLGSTRSASLPIQYGAWNHVAGVYHGSSDSAWMAVFVNGVRSLKLGFKGEPPTIVSSGGPLNIGRDPVSLENYFVGLIDEVEIFNRALTDDEIMALYDAGSEGKCKVTTVAIDIKPGSFPNSINLSSAGVIPVTIISSETFDATTVDPETVSLAGASVKMVGKSGRYLCHEEDVNGDDLADLVCQVYTAQFMIEAGESVAVLEAGTLNGQAIRGEDSVRIVPDQ
jgi:hypothetical protein